MANNEAPVIELDQLMQERNGIAATRDADEIRSILRKLREDLQLEVTVICSALPHSLFNVEALSAASAWKLMNI